MRRVGILLRMISRYLRLLWEEYRGVVRGGDAGEAGMQAGRGECIV